MSVPLGIKRLDMVAIDEFKGNTDNEKYQCILTNPQSGKLLDILPEFDAAITAFINWFEYILNSKDTPLTNAFTEGKNNKIKVLKRNAYGYRNFARFRNRILHCG